jgi:hypothetical protein
MLQEEEIKVFFEVGVILRYANFHRIGGGGAAVSSITKRLMANNLLLRGILFLNMGWILFYAPIILGSYIQ